MVELMRDFAEKERELIERPYRRDGVNKLLICSVLHIFTSVHSSKSLNIRNTKQREHERYNYVMN